MSPSTEQIFKSAQALPIEGQVELIEALIATLDESAPQPLDADWMAEIQRRSTEYDAGLVRPIPWSEVRERAHPGDSRS